MHTWHDINIWRKALRKELIAARVALDREQRRCWSERITASLKIAFCLPAGSVIGYCWPYKNEFDARIAIRHWCGCGAIAALPVVVEKAHPLQFRQWWPGAPMRPGVYGIPVPDGTPTLLPDVAIVPMNGFDEQGYRLGYGGGYFDRTLDALERRVLTIGVSFEALRLPTIRPQPHDVPMDFVVTEAGIWRAGGKPLDPLEAAACISAVASLLQTRRLPRVRLLVAGGHGSPAC